MIGSETYAGFRIQRFRHAAKVAGNLFANRRDWAIIRGMGLAARIIGFLKDRFLKNLAGRKNPVPGGITEASVPTPARPTIAGFGEKMHLLEDSLYEFMIDNGVPAGTARDAARNCARSVTRYAAGGAVIGATLGWKTMNPSTLLMAVVAGAGAGAVGAGLSPSCAEVRQAADNWAAGALP
jgi:hypothetical protein